jgi:hypothetical protein
VRLTPDSTHVGATVMRVIKNDVYHVSKHGGWTVLFVLVQEISLVICSIGKRQTCNYTFREHQKKVNKETDGLNNYVNANYNGLITQYPFWI